MRNGHGIWSLLKSPGRMLGIYCMNNILNKNKRRIYKYIPTKHWVSIGDRIIDSALTMPCFLEHVKKNLLTNRNPSSTFIIIQVISKCGQAHKSESLTLLKCVISCSFECRKRLLIPLI